MAPGMCIFALPSRHSPCKVSSVGAMGSTIRIYGYSEGLVAKHALVGWQTQSRQGSDPCFHLMHVDCVEVPTVLRYFRLCCGARKHFWDGPPGQFRI